MRFCGLIIPQKIRKNGHSAERNSLELNLNKGYFLLGHIMSSLNQINK